MGAANYIIGSLPGIKKLFLGVAGIHGDKKLGIQQLQLAADHGRYQRPFAKILLAMAALREKKPELARVQLSELAAEFPGNPLFVSKLAKLKPPPAAAILPRVPVAPATSLRVRAQVVNAASFVRASFGASGSLKP